MYNSPKVIQHNLNLSTDEFTNLNSRSNLKTFWSLKNLLPFKGHGTKDWADEWFSQVSRNMLNNIAYFSIYSIIYLQSHTTVMCNM